YLVRGAVVTRAHVRRRARRRVDATHLALHVLGEEPLQEVDDLGPVAVLADDRQLTAVEMLFLVDGGQRDPVVVYAVLRALRERRVDERRLTVQVALRRVVEHR